MADPIPPQLPHVIIEEPKRSPVAIIAIIIVSLMLFAIPVGVYLTLHNQNPTSKAVNNETTEPKEETGIFFETDKNQVGVGSVFPVRVIVRSVEEEANLFILKALYPQNLLEIVKIESLPDEDTGYLSIPNARVIQQKYNNLSGSLNLIIGVPDPGLKTNLSDRKYGVATIYFRSKDIGEAKITSDDQTSIFSNKTKKNINQKKQTEFNLSIVSEVQPENALDDDEDVPNTKTVSSSGLAFVTPTGGETFPFNQDIPVRWNLDEKKMPYVTVSLYMNGKLFGILAKNIPNKGEFIFKPNTALQPLFATDSNTFQFQIEGKSNTGQDLVFMEEGPFGIYNSNNFVFESSPNINIKDNARDLTGDNQINPEDLSQIFADFGKKDEKSLKSDLSGDKAVNDVDLWILKKGLVLNGILEDN